MQREAEFATVNFLCLSGFFLDIGLISGAPTKAEREVHSISCTLETTENKKRIKKRDRWHYLLGLKD